MQCHYFDTHQCFSCTELDIPYPKQLSAKERHMRELAAGYPQIKWLEAVPSQQKNFRNKAKIVVSGTTYHPVLGIVHGGSGQGTDLSQCPLYEPALLKAMPVLKEFITRAQLTPYHIKTRKGELKNILMTASSSGELMVRCVLRSKKLIVPIKRSLPWLQERLPQLRVFSVNLLREPIARVEGEEEIILSSAQTLAMRANDITLHLRPQSFFQTNSSVASTLYRQGQEWVSERNPASLWDLYCGVGGFAIHAAQVMSSDARVTGIEISAEAIESAHRTVADMGLNNTHFEAMDATAFALESQKRGFSLPEMLVVNPPRRGIGAVLCQWIEQSGIDTVLYSSCNAKTLIKDLQKMPSYQPVQGRVLDMFAHTQHYEVMVLLRRQDYSSESSSG
ncbi:23S rRNA (uracil(747)-C(5))-methyltransferase RlmC [Rothia sp. CCM 9418]|uniref:23S rRNA (uracil(747)-C(5))-methyltransferase RlmC n=1 Tax=Rothia sp. CCM 9418 TaxID=3402661 RepID=UPI003ADF09A2